MPAYFWRGIYRRGTFFEAVTYLLDASDAETAMREGWQRAGLKSHGIARANVENACDPNDTLTLPRPGTA